MKIPDCEGCKNEDIGDNEPSVLNSDMHLSDIEVSSVSSSDISRDHTDSRYERDDNGPNIVKEATVTVNLSISN